MFLSDSNDSSLRKKEKPFAHSQRLWILNFSARNFKRKICQVKIKFEWVYFAVLLSLQDMLYLWMLSYCKSWARNEKYGQGWYLSCSKGVTVLCNQILFPFLERNLTSVSTNSCLRGRCTWKRRGWGKGVKIRLVDVHYFICPAKLCLYSSIVLIICFVDKHCIIL